MSRKKISPESEPTVRDVRDEMGDLIFKGFGDCKIKLKIGEDEHDELELVSVQAVNFEGSRTVYFRF